MLIRLMFMIQMDLTLPSCYRIRHRKRSLSSNLGSQLTAGFNYFKHSEGTSRKNCILANPVVYHLLSGGLI